MITRIRAIIAEQLPSCFGARGFEISASLRAARARRCAATIKMRERSHPDCRAIRRDDTQEAALAPPPTKASFSAVSPCQPLNVHFRYFHAFPAQLLCGESVSRVKSSKIGADRG